MTARGGQCAKCGRSEHTLRYHPPHDVCSRDDRGGLRNGEAAEHLHFFCSRCGYDWVGKCSDAEAIA